MPRPASRPAFWFNDLFSEMPTLMACVADSAAEATPSTLRLPVDIVEKDGAYVLTASVPGFKKDEVSVQFDKGVLTIEAKRASSTEEKGTDEGVTWHRRERRCVDLARSIRLPEGITGEGIAATIVDGVLTVTVPQPPEKQPHKIRIN
ncbi:MAG: Hsp20/alpha crystallin family protein [Phycisphaerales bacterium]